MDPRVTWRLGALLGGLGFLVSLVMLLSIGSGVTRAQPWKIGCLGFGALASISTAGLLITRRR